MNARPTREQLQEALQASRLHMPLDDALLSPTLYIALRNTAHALAARKASTARRPVIDHKRLAAGDID
ncbi:hypothetical protein H0A71_05965 [Alcaligenaceae bacterium]|nr:hypothetical protein [Alcaligenaceae bacterium]